MVNYVKMEFSCTFVLVFFSFDLIQNEWFWNKIMERKFLLKFCNRTADSNDLDDSSV